MEIEEVNLKSTDDHIPIKKLTSNEISRNTVLIVNSSESKKLMHQRLFNNDVSVFLVRVFFKCFKFYKNDCEIQ